MRAGTIIFLLFFLVIQVAKGQDVYPITRNEFDWKKYDQTDKRQIIDFINTHKNYFGQFKRKAEYSSLTIDDLIKSIHFIDLDKNGIKEIVFDGQGEAEGNETLIFQKIDNQYLRVFTGRQSIVDIRWQNNGDTKIYISDFGCCAEYTNTQKIFKLTKPDNIKIKLIKTYQSLVFNEGYLPDSFFTSPVRFKVTVDNYKLRHTPKFDDTSYQAWDCDTSKPVGNVIATLQKNVFGYALGYKTDKSKRQWWYVEIDQKSAMKNVRLSGDSEYPSKLVGWISSNYLKRQ
jgi:hypothetical protein